MKVEEADEPQLATVDIWRSAVLGRAILTWGMPETRIVSYHADFPYPLEVYSFPPSQASPVYRFLSVGLSLLQHHAMGRMQCSELLLVLPPSLAGITTTDALKLVLDVAAHGLLYDLAMDGGTIIEPVSIFPRSWTTNSLLLTEAVAEPDQIALMQIGPVSVDLLWIIPLYISETAVIRQRGRVVFEGLVEQLQDELVNPLRLPFASE